MRAKFAAVSTSASTARTAATCSALPARVPPKPRCELYRTPGRTDSRGACAQRRPATAALTP
jgi:hypothetical protein